MDTYLEQSLQDPFSGKKAGAAKKKKFNGAAKRTYIEYTIYNLLKKDKSAKAIILEKKVEIKLKKLFSFEKKDYDKVLSRLEDKEYIKKTTTGYEFMPA